MSMSLIVNFRSDFLVLLHSFMGFPDIFSGFFRSDFLLYKIRSIPTGLPSDFFADQPHISLYFLVFLCYYIHDTRLRQHILQSNPVSNDAYQFFHADRRVL